jgi:hypothetical protein
MRMIVVGYVDMTLDPPQKDASTSKNRILPRTAMLLRGLITRYTDGHTQGNGSTYSAIFRR